MGKAKESIDYILPIDISTKKNLDVQDEDPTASQIQEEIRRLQDRIDQNMQLYFAEEAAIQRVLNRSLLDLFRDRITDAKMHSQRNISKKAKTKK